MAATKRKTAKRAAKKSKKPPTPAAPPKTRANALITRIRSKLGKAKSSATADLLTSGEGRRSSLPFVIPTGIEVLDHYVFGVGGLPGGRIIEVFSEEGVGKTSFVYQCLAETQRRGGLAYMIENEHTFDAVRAAEFGVDTDQLGFSQPDTLEDATQIIEAATAEDAGVPLLIAWDTLAAAPTAKEVAEGLIGKDKVGERAKALSKAMRHLGPLVARSRAVLIIVNQVRDKVGVMFGPDKTTPGGHAVKFHSSVRLQLFGGKSVKDGVEHIGKSVTFLSVKNKLAPPFRKARVRLMYSGEWDNEWSTINHAKDRKVIPAKARVSAANLTIARRALGWPSPLALETLASIDAAFMPLERGTNLATPEEVGEIEVDENDTGIVDHGEFDPETDDLFGDDE